MCGFFNSNKNRIAVTSRGNKRSYQGQNRRIVQSMMYDNRTKTQKPVTEEVYVTKKQAEAMDLGFTGYSLKYGNMMLIGDIDAMLPDCRFEHAQYNNLLTNGVFEGIGADKIGLVYSPKFKKFLYLALNDNYTIGILFKNENYNELPNVPDIDNLDPRIEIRENANRLLYTVFYESEILDLTSNPIMHYGINEVFTK